jgi:hypothetical protein
VSTQAQAQANVARYIDANGIAVIPGTRIASGGEGSIFEVAGDAGRVLKIYHQFAPGRLAKLRSMLATPPDDPFRSRSNHISFCWPEGLVFDEQGVSCGFIMPRLDCGTHQPVAVYWNPHDRREIAPGFTWKYLVVTGANIASLVDLLHAQGHVIGDLNEENILVDSRALVTIVDCDSMQIREAANGTLHRSPVAREAYISPERLGIAMATCDRTPQDDCWALAVLLFQLLMEGQHPTDGRGVPEARHERLRHGIFPCLGHPGLSAPKYSVPLDVLTPEVLDLFVRCFRDGHSDPSLRPSAAEWRAALTKLGASLLQCPANELHWYAPHRGDCPWCEESARWGLDRLAPAAAGGQITLPFAAAPVKSASTPVTPVSAQKALPLWRRARVWVAAAAAGIVLAVVPGTITRSNVPTAAPAKQSFAGPLPLSPSAPRPQPKPVVEPPPSVIAPKPAPKRYAGNSRSEGTRFVKPAVVPNLPPPVVPASESQNLQTTQGSATVPANVPPLVPAQPTEPRTLPQAAPPPASASELLKLARDLGARSTAPPPMLRASGTLIWTGEVRKNVPVVIGSSEPSGLLRGEQFPGVPIVIEQIAPAGLAVTEPPSPSNGFQRLVLRSDFSRNQVITISWRTP